MAEAAAAGSAAVPASVPALRHARHEDVLALGRSALGAVEALFTAATASVRQRVDAGGKISGAALEREQHAVHGLAWLATYVESIRQLVAYGERLSPEGLFGETEDLLTPWCI